MALEKTYEGITRSMIDRIKTRVVGDKVKLPEGDRGIIEGGHGIKLDSTYDETTSTLRLCILHKPEDVADNKIWDQIDEDVAFAKSV